MKRFAWSVLAVCAAVTGTIWGPAVASAQSKPIAVVGLSSVGELVEDVKYVMELAGQGPMVGVVDGMVGGFTQGLDRQRPICVAIFEQEGEISGMAMLPVTDLKALLATVTMRTGPPRDLGNGVMEIAGPHTVYVKESNGWAYVSNAQTNLETLPADPAALLGGLEKKYDIAARGVVQNISPGFKQMALQQLEASLAAQLDNAESDEERATQEQLMKSQIENIRTLLTETDSFTFGINIDRDAETALLETTHIAMPGTKTANQYAKLRDLKTAFGGFRNDEAAVNARFVSAIAPEDAATAAEALGPVREQMLKEVQEDDDIPNEQARALATSLINKVFDLVEETMKAGKIDGGATLLLNDQKLTFLAGLHVADGKKVEEALDEVVKLGQNEPDFPGVKKNADKIGNVALHTMRIPVPEEDDARKFLGENLDVVLGVGPKSAYLAFGNDCQNQLKLAIESSQSEAAVDSLLHVNVAIGTILQFASHFDDEPTLAAFAQAFQEHAGNDNIVITGTAIENGTNVRLEVQSGVLKSVGAITGQAAGAGPGF